MAGYQGRFRSRLSTRLVATRAWFFELMQLRDELTHSTIGFVTRDKNTGHLNYLHPGLAQGNRCFVVENVVAKIEEFMDGVDEFLRGSFAYLCSTLKDVPATQICGIFNARIYARTVRPSEAVDFHAGICDSYEWFERDGNPPCPLREACGAYTLRKGQRCGPYLGRPTGDRCSLCIGATLFRLHPRGACGAVPIAGSLSRHGNHPPQSLPRLRKGPFREKPPHTRTMRFKRNSF